MNKKVKKADGTIVEVEEGYILKEGESFVEETAEEKEKREKEESEAADKKAEEEAKDGIKTFIKSETVEALNKELDKISDELVKKFFSGVKEQRNKVIDEGVKPKKDSDQELVRKWYTCLVNHDMAGVRLIEKDYLQVGDEVQGGYTVPPPALLAEINRFTEEYGVARRDMRYLPMSGAGNSRMIPALGSSVSVFWVGEGKAKHSSKPTFALVEQVLKKIATICPLTEELMSDSAINIISLLGELIGEAVAKEEDRVYFTGSIGAGDVFNGILNAVGVVVVPMAVGKLVEDITYDDLMEVMYSVPKEVRQKGKFYLNSQVTKVLRKLKDIEGRYVVQSPTGGQPENILNKPYEEVDVLPDDTVDTEDTPFLIFTDLRKTCVYGDKGGLTVKLLDQAIVESAEESPSDLNLATQDMVALRAVKRTGYVPVLPAGIAVLATGEGS